MKISIITVVYNDVNYIKETILSVLNQSYKNVEYLIIDGGSTDGTLKEINKYKKKIFKIISEKDNGIYDAMNKGIKLSTGDIIGFLNSGDLYFDSYVLGKVVREFKKRNVDSVYGDLVYVKEKNVNKIIRYWKAGNYEWGLFKKGWHPPHPAFFVRKDIYKKCGYFDLEFKISADFEIMLRFLEKCKISTSYIPEVLVKMRYGGVSNNSLLNILKANYECYRAWRKNGFKINFITVLRKPIRKIVQFAIKKRNSY